MRLAAPAREVLLPPVIAGAVVVGMLGGLAGASGIGSHARSPLAPVADHNDLSIALAHGPVPDGSATRATLAERTRPWRLIGTIAGT